MAEVKWIKITTNMFDDEKIKLIDAMPERDTIHYIWIRLLVQAGKTNANGYIFLNENVPYTEEMLSTIFNRPLNSVRLALKTLNDFGMIELSENHLIKITNWSKHQNIEGMEKVREQTKKRVAKHRAKKKELLESAKEETCGSNEAKKSVTLHETLSNGTEEDKEEDIDIEEDNNLLYIENNIEKIIDYYCSKAGIVSINFKPKEFETVEELLQKVPVDVIKKGIDDAFKNYKPSFKGEKISSFNYCKPVILKIWNNINIKKKGANSKDGNNSSSTDEQQRLTAEGIGI
ncbi:replication protein [Clostridium botulinum]|uniref:phage replisome organizer N-terminal domain-containing protein n=1 Tax=Clostridium botulinum TaxID=1491 RepID=UPI0013763A2C|nr:phage replisome organizer N-terminal domain-containing protein [Clostridium botulinum]MCC5416335.1 phage replisome organizer N-terminal domain-containing protein [Clostridium botulinum]NCI18562.1 replication protein [Clostridium botulinum]NCI37168.1 replication protein [Clostridium botulinum]NCI72728.1 replication protein [Clostridium botulinum]NDI40270.1 replication protein [Clostridium botulinum]